MHMVEQVREAARRVAGEAQHVRIEDAPLASLATRLHDQPLPTWDGELHYFDGTERSVMYALLLDAVNFCFWPSPEYEVDYRGKSYGKEDGYCALAVALKRAFEEGMPLWEPVRLASLTAQEYRHVLRGSREIALFDRRLAHARDLGETLMLHYGADVRRLMERAGGDASGLVDELAAHFACYADFREWKGERVPVLKRAQIVTSDLVGSFAGKGYGALAGADRLTCFADYKLPQLFRSYGIFAYDEGLDRRIRALEEIPEGSAEEVEIRMCTIEAVERLAARIGGLGRTIAPRELDWLLWNESVKPGLLTEPHHRTVTSSY